MRSVVARVVAIGLLLPLVAGAAAAVRTLDMFFIDVEGGQSTLIITPAGQSILIDAGYGGARGSRDPDRIMAAIREAGLERIDYLLVTHLHPDHVGGVPELASRIPIDTFIDYGPPLGFDRMTTGNYRLYEPVRNQARHIVPRPGDRLPLEGVTATVVSAGGAVLSEPLAGGGQRNPEACATVEDQPEDGTENYRSIGVMFELGSFRFLDLGDLSGNTLASLACPANLLGRVDAYLVPHHGDYDANIPALITALGPRVAIMNNGVTRGGAPDAFRTLHAQPGLEDLWQLHASRNQGADNSPDAYVANVDEGLSSYWIRLTASEDGGFRVINARNGFVKTYSPAAKPHRR